MSIFDCGQLDYTELLIRKILALWYLPRQILRNQSFIIKNKVTDPCCQF